MTKSVLRVHVHAVCPCPCCMNMLHAMSISMLHFMLMLNSMPMLHSMSMLHVHAYVHLHVEMPEMPDCPVSGQFGTGLKINNDAGTGPVPDEAESVRYFFSPVPD